MLIEQRECQRRRLVSLREDAGPGLLQDLASNKGGRVLRDVGVLDSRAGSHEVLLAALYIGERGGEPRLEGTDRAALAREILQRAIEHTHRLARVDFAGK